MECILGLGWSGRMQGKKTFENGPELLGKKRRTFVQNQNNSEHTGIQSSGGTDRKQYQKDGPGPDHEGGR